MRDLSSNDISSSVPKQSLCVQGIRLHLDFGFGVSKVKRSRSRSGFFLGGPPSFSSSEGLSFGGWERLFPTPANTTTDIELLLGDLSDPDPDPDPFVTGGDDSVSCKLLRSNPLPRTSISVSVDDCAKALMTTEAQFVPMRQKIEEYMAQ
jgi:hypothetical protein